MRLFAGMLLLGASLPGVAWAQVQADDPCYPRAYASPLAQALLGGQSQSRQAACVAERKAQWDSYYAQQAQRAADEKVAEARQRSEQEREQARLAADERRRLLEEKVAAHEEAKRRYLSYIQMRDEEASPDNHCRAPDTARLILQQWNEFDRFRLENLKAVDIEHLTTAAFNPDTGVMVCHGIFVTNQGGDVIGTFSTRRNVAGDLISSWEPDASQDTSRYQPPADPDPVPLQTTNSIEAFSSTSHSPLEQGSDPGSFAAGLGARKQWEAWLVTLTGDEREGATWWAASRNSPRHSTCADAPSKDNAAWEAGCLNASAKLTPIDAKRRADPVYKKGWNSL